MNFGGPVWHASVSSPDLTKRLMRELAMSALRGVGDEQHQWEEEGGIAFHVRRRLTSEEMTRTGHIKDVRNTPEAEEIRQKMRRIASPKLWKHFD